MRLVKYLPLNKVDIWFIHYEFQSKHDPFGEELEDYERDQFDAYWDLPAVEAVKNTDYFKHFSSPDQWPYVRNNVVSRIGTTNLHLGKWVRQSPFYDEKSGWKY